MDNLRAEVSRINIATHPGFKQYEDLALGLFEMGVVEFGIYNGWRLDQPRFNQALARRYLVFEDRCELTSDIAAHLHREILKITCKSQLEYRFSYKILPNYHVLVGVDARDLSSDAEDGNAVDWVGEDE